MTLYCRDERRYTEQIRMMIQETGSRVEEVVVSAADEEKMKKDGKLMFMRLPKFVTSDGTEICESTYTDLLNMSSLLCTH